LNIARISGTLGLTQKDVFSFYTVLAIYLAIQIVVCITMFKNARAWYAKGAIS